MWRNRMSKIDKMIDKMERKNMKDQDQNAKWLRERLFQNADDIRALSTISQDINEFSEILDELEYFEKLLEKQSLFQILLNTVHGQKLVDLGFKDDIEFCSNINKILTVPTSLNEIEELPAGQKVVKLT